MSKVDIKDILGAIDTCDFDFYDNLSEEEQKEFSSWLAMRFASSSANYSEYYLLQVNNLVNVNFSDLRSHPKLQWLLLASSGCGRKHYHPYIKPPKKGTADNGVEDFVKSKNPLWNSEEVSLFCRLNQENMRQYMESFGLDEKEIKKYLG